MLLLSGASLFIIRQEWIVRAGKFLFRSGKPNLTFNFKTGSLQELQGFALEAGLQQPAVRLEKCLAIPIQCVCDNIILRKISSLRRIPMAAISFSAIQEALSQPTSPFFWLSHDHGHFETGDPVSFYSKSDLTDDDLSFDIANNKVLANVAKNGSINRLVFYHGNAQVDSFFPGMWLKKLYTQEGPFSFGIQIDGKLYNLNQVDWMYRTSLLDHIFPITVWLQPPLRITTIAYAPISSDGSCRLRGLIYGALVENLSDRPVQGCVIAPSTESKVTFSLDNESTYICFAESSQPYQERLIDPRPGLDKWSPVKNPIRLEVLDFSLEPGQSFWAPAVLSAAGESIVAAVEEKGTLAWLNETWSYFRSLTGHLSMPDDRYAEAFFQRTVHQCIESIGMDADGRPVGSDLGTSPTTEVICMKDLYYAYLPLAMLEPEFFKKGILWFLETSVRPRGNKFGAGGIEHSLSISLTPVMMAGLYYSVTRDKAFFRSQPELMTKLNIILQQTMQTRKQADIWLFPSRFISDGPAQGDYHTGSNVCAWYAFQSFARIMEDVFADLDRAAQYTGVASRIKAALEQRNVIDGPFGPQYNEGINQDGSLPVLGHEGEENDTTLMPFYGYKAYDDLFYQNYMAFSVSEHNRFYTPHLKGIKFAVEQDAITEATCPGYVTGFATVRDGAGMSGDNGRLTEIRRHVDVDGSMWWWPYFRKGTYGEVRRLNHEIPLYPGKCAWGSGVYLGLFISVTLGIRFDALTRTLHFRPFSPSSDFTWDDLRAGSATFSVAFSRQKDAVVVSMTNQCPFRVALALEIPLEEGLAATRIHSGERDHAFRSGTFLGRTTVLVSESLKAGEQKIVTVSCTST